MGNILNSMRQLQLFRGRYEGSYFVDKSEILIKLNNLIGKKWTNSLSASPDQDVLERPS